MQYIDALRSMNLKPLALTDKPIFDSVYSEYKDIPSILNFVNLWVWREAYSVHWAIIDKYLCVFAEFDPDTSGNMIMWGPPLPLDGHFGNDYSNTLDKCFDILDNRERTIEPRIYYVWDQLLPLLTENGYKLYPAPGSADYIYRTQSLKTLKGKLFKQKRKELSKFQSTYQYRVEEYSSDLRSDCLKLLDIWFENKLSKLKPITDQKYTGWSPIRKLYAETDATRVLLNCDSVLGIRGIVIMISGKVKAFAIGCSHSLDSTLLLEERADTNFKGIYCKTLFEFCQRCVTTEFINLESDWNLDYLQHAKLRWNPERLFITYYSIKR